MRWMGWIATALVSLNVYAVIEGPRKVCETKRLLNGTITVEYTNDGDTVALKAADGTLVHTRLLGIDTPETHFFGKNQGPWAFQAAQRLKSLLPKGTSVELEFDTISCDSKARTLAYIILNGVNLNRLMIDEGWAVNYCVAPNFMNCEEFSQLVGRNIIENRGFLSDPSVEIPYLFRAEDHDQSYEYFIGNIDTKLVVSSKEIAQVPVEKRVFFYSARKIAPPYHL